MTARVMKSKIAVFIMVAISLLVYTVYTSVNYDPLSQENKQLIVGDEKVKMELIFSKDLIGLSLKGELFDIYIYNTNLQSPPLFTPEILEWQGKKHNENCRLYGWSKLLKKDKELDSIPLHALHMADHQLTFEFLQDIKNNSCHFFYIKFHEMENYLFLYSETSKKLCYIRNRG
ncbi:MAG: hypothetical protein ACK4WD_04930 [Flavobacteriales bacterium]|jgi:hypothetical protein